MTKNGAEDFLSLFGSMVVINLPYRKDRREEFEAQLRQIGLGFDHPKVRLFDAVRPEDPAGFPTVGTRGCFLSHLGALRAAAADGQDSILICEDDLDFAPTAQAEFSSLAAALRDQPWDLFYGGYDARPDGIEVLPGLVRADSDRAIGCTHFYAVRGAAISDLVRYLETMMGRKPGHPEGGPMHYDGALTWFRAAHPGYITLAAVPPFGVQRPSRTDIHALRWFDRWPIIREMAGGLRRIRARRKPG